MSGGPLVSAVIATYNRAEFLCDAIDSVLSQSYDNIEIQVVDDGSEDGTSEIVQDLYGCDSRIHYFYQSNQGQATARNVGIQNSRGTFIGFLDSDNRWLPDRIQRQVSCLVDNPEIGVVYGDVITIDEKGAEISRDNMTRCSGHITEELLKHNCVSFNTSLVRTTCLRSCGGLNPSIRAADDYDLWLRLSAITQFQYIAEFFAEYRVMDNQISSDKSKRFESTKLIVEQFLESHPNIVDPIAIARARSHFYTRRGRYFASDGNKLRALSDYWQALRFHPGALAPWRGILRLLVSRST